MFSLSGKFACALERLLAHTVRSADPLELADLSFLPARGVVGQV